MKYYQRNEEALNAEREKDKTADSGGSGSDNFYNLKNGRTVIRVLPSWSNEGLWFREIREYYFRMGEQHLFLTSPLDFGQPDPLDEYNQAVFEIGTDDAKKEAKRFRFKFRYLLNGIVLSDSQGTTSQDGIKVIKVPKTVKMQLVDFDTDTEYGDITNPEKGFNMIIDREGEGLDTKYSVKAQRERTNIFETLVSAGIDPNQMNMFDLDQIHRNGLKSYEELSGLLEQLKGPFGTSALAGSAPAQPAFPVANNPGVVQVPTPLSTTPAPKTVPVTTPVATPMSTAGGPVMQTPEGTTVEVPEVPAAPNQGGE